MSKSELCRHLLRAYLFYARELKKQEQPYEWVLQQLRDINRLRLYFKEIEEGETMEFIFKGAA